MTISLSNIDPELGGNRGYLLIAHVFNKSAVLSGETYRDAVISFFIFTGLYDKYLLNQGNFHDLIYGFAKNLLGFSLSTNDSPNSENADARAFATFAGVHPSHPFAKPSERKYLKQTLCFLATLSTKTRDLIIQYLNQVPAQEAEELLSADDLTLSYASEKSQAFFCEQAAAYFRLVSYNPEVNNNIKKIPTQTITLSHFSKKNGNIIFTEPTVVQIYELLNKTMVSYANCDYMAFFDKVISFFITDFVVPVNNDEPSIQQLNNAALNFVNGLVLDLAITNSNHPFKEYKTRKEISNQLSRLLSFFRKYYPVTATVINENFAGLFQDSETFSSISCSFTMDSLSGGLEYSIPLNEAPLITEPECQIGFKRYLLTCALRNGGLELDAAILQLHQFFISNAENYLTSVFIYFSPVHLFRFGFMQEDSKAAIQAKAFVEYALKSLENQGLEKIRSNFTDFRDFFMTLYPHTRSQFYQYTINYNVSDSLVITSASNAIAVEPRMFEKPIRFKSKVGVFTYTFTCDFSREVSIGGLKATVYPQQGRCYHHDRNDRAYHDLQSAFLTKLKPGEKQKYFNRVIDYFSLEQHEKIHHEKVKTEAFYFVKGLIPDLRNYCRLATGFIFQAEAGFTRSYMELLLLLIQLHGNVKSEPTGPSLQEIVLVHLKENQHRREFINYGTNPLFFRYRKIGTSSYSLSESEQKRVVALKFDAVPQLALSAYSLIAPN